MDSARGIPICGLCLLLGNLLVHQLADLPGRAFCFGIGFVAVLMLVAPRTRAAACFLIGAAWTAIFAQGSLAHRLPAALDGQDLRVSGWVDDFVDRNQQSVTFSLRVDSVEPTRDESVPPLHRLRLTWYDDAPAIAPAAKLDLRVRLRQPRGLRNPGGFDYERWLFLSGYSATGYVRSGAAAAVTDTGLSAHWLSLRARIADRISAAAASTDAAALLRALVVGERSGFSDDMWMTFRRTGTSHLVAISGLHIGLIATFTFVLVGLAVRRVGYLIAAFDIELAAIAAALAAFTYAGLAGFGVPTQRALVMCLFALIVFTSRRYASVLNGFSGAVIVVLALDPLATLTASFWMSFAAVAVLLVVVRGQASIHHAAIGSERRLVSWLRQLFRVQCMLTLALAPLAVGFFSEVSILALAVNVVAIPVFSFVVVPAALLTTVASTAMVELSWSIWLVSALADWILSALHWCAVQPGAVLTPIIAAPTAAMIAAAGVGIALPWHQCPGRRLGWLALAPLFYPAVERPTAGGLNLVVLDVGHGLSVIAETHEHRLLYDAGALARSGFDAGRQLVLPALRSRYSRGLDALIVSHADNDHRGGAGAVIDAHPEAWILHGPDVSGLPGETCRAGQRWVWDSVRFEMLHPSDSFEGSGNDSSCVLKITAGPHSVLLTGDIERRAERALQREEGLPSDVVLVPHHGSATSSSAEFVARVSPGIAIVSAGFDNRWGFPRTEVSRRWQDAGAEMYVTGDGGAISVSADGSQLSVRRERDRRRRYWQADAPRFPG